MIWYFWLLMLLDKLEVQVHAFFLTSNRETLAFCNIDTSTGIFFSSLDKVVNELRSRKSWTVSNENQIRKGSERKESWGGKSKYHGQ